MNQQGGQLLMKDSSRQHCLQNAAKAHGEGAGSQRTDILIEVGGGAGRAP